MTALWLNVHDQDARELRRVGLTGGRDERWLQRVLFEHPDLVPLDLIEPGAGAMIPVCRELTLPGKVRLDLFGVTRHGRPVLVECKLWRNPQARREVVAQLLEYAALLTRWTYADLTEQLRPFLSVESSNPLFDRAAEAYGEADEAEFVDAVSRNMRAGDFHLIIAGDGIREDLHAVAEHLLGRGARLALVEFQLWADDDGNTLVVPSIPMRTELVRQQLVVDPQGVRVEVDEADHDSDVGATVDPKRLANRDFWQRFIETVHFDHADQGPPRHGGNNWVKIPLPHPADRLTAYRYGDHIGFFLVWDRQVPVYEELRAEADALREETGLMELRFHQLEKPDLEDAIGVSHPRVELGGDEGELKWLRDTANRLVSALRPRLARMRE